MEHRIGTQEEWHAERDELLQDEKELTQRLEKDGRLTSELIKATKGDAFFFPVTMEPVASVWALGQQLSLT